MRHAMDAPFPYGRIVEILIRTEMRRGEVAQLEWGFIDDADKVMVLPAGLVKNNRTHSMPIGEGLAETLISIPRINQYRFPSSHEKATVFNGWGKAKERFDEGLNGVAPYTLHDLRRTFATAHARIGTPIHATEKLLSHVSGTISGVAAVYNRHTYLEEMRKAVTAYDEFLTNLVTD